jgi:outer membrane protein OmpA-like peptidoglycan-associated protein
MRYRVAIVVLFAFLSGCSGSDGKTFPVYFQPFSADLDPQAQATVHAAAAFASAHPLMPLTIPGYATPPSADALPTLRQEQVGAVREALIREGVDRLRIEIQGTGAGLVDHGGVPNITPGEVDIAIGL